MREPKIYLDYILESCERVARYMQGQTYEEFRDNDMLRDAVAMNLVVVGEMAKRLPQDMRDDMPGVEWHLVAGNRDVLAHDYPGVAIDVLWATTHYDLPAMYETVRHYLEAIE